MSGILNICLLFSLLWFLSIGSFIDEIEEPISTLCAKRNIHATSPAGQNYFFSWRSEGETDEENYVDARNFCRMQCMELVSLETYAENEWIKQFIVKDEISSVYTSGHLCDFKGCDRPDFQPLDAFGWFWTGSEERLSNTYLRDENDWSNESPDGPQPDNREFEISGRLESCLIFKNLLCDGVHWHDSTCDVKRHFICEDSPTLLDFITKRFPGLKV